MLRTLISEKDATVEVLDKEVEELLDTIEELTTSKDALEADYRLFEFISTAEEGDFYRRL